MATLKKLKVCGVRSFGADDADFQTIYFDKPFNLILGRNGCGKTTIIESLKYACTGCLPSGQGGNFVRDPKLDRKLETRAQVKLNYVCCRGKNSTITRNMSVTQKYKSLTFKTMETVHEVKESDGTPKHLSSRCAEMNELMSHSLGVSDPILNYVIFCHQEDSYWPLDEGRKVKERFDEIFDSTKYNKCMVEVRKIRKNVISETKVCQESILHLESKVALLKQKRGELEHLIKRFDSNEEATQKHEQELAEYDEEYSVWRRRYQEYEKLKTDKDIAKNDLDKLEHEWDTQRKYISVEFTGTEDELLRAIRTFDGQLQEKEEAIECIRRNIQKMENAESQTQNKILEVQKLIGRLEADKIFEEKTKADRNFKVSNLAKVFVLPVLVDNASEEDVSNLVGELKREFKNFASSISLLKLKHEKEQNDLQEVINKCLKEKTKVESEINMKEDTIDSHNIDIRNLKMKLNDINMHLESKEKIDNELEKCRIDREKAVKSEDSQALSSTIEDLCDVCQRLEERQKHLSSEVVQLFKHQEAQKDLSKSEDKCKEFQTCIRRLRSKNDDFISEHLINSSDSSIKHDLETLIHKLKREVEQLKNQLSEKNQEVSSLDQDRKHKKDLLDFKQSELGKKKETYFKLCGKKKLPDILESVQSEIEAIQANRAMFNSSKLVFTRFIKQLEKKEPCCPLCHRNFENELDPMEIIDELSTKINSVPNQVEEQNEKLAKLQDKQRNLLKLEPVEKDIKNLEDIEIPNLQNDLGGIELVLDTTREEISCLEVRLQDPEKNLRLAESIQSDVYDIDRCQKESKQLLRQIEILKRDLPPGSSSRTSEQAVAEQQLVQDELSVKRAEKNSAEERQRVYVKQINDLDQKMNKLVAQQLKIRELVQQEDSMKERLTELSSLTNVLEAELKELNQTIKPITENKKKAEEALDAAKEKNKREIQAVEKKKSEREIDLRGISDLEESLSNLRSQNIAITLDEKKQTHERLVAKIHEVKEQKEKLAQESTDLSDIIKGHSQKKMELEGNLTLMKVSKQIERQKKTLECAEQKLGGTDSRGIVNKINTLDEKKSSLKSKINELRGKQQGLHDNIESRKEELNEGHLKNAEQKYKEKLVQLTVQLHVEKDLQKFYNSLDYAMQNFHKDRMEIINKIIRELWRLIYQGNDIDYIEIKTEESTPAVTQATDRKRVYNYRVVQVKHGTELEMRGRCSAGQKVLASLIIRMALAETFSANCGILTLDEPTTNLDKQNIQSLCEAIMNVVNDREGNKSFQLIVITHDRDFLQMMSQMDFFSHYWEVSRNHQSKSQIIKRDVIKD